MKQTYNKKQINILIVVLLTAFLTTFTGNALNLSVPSIEKQFGASAEAVGWVMTLYTLVCAALAVPFGKLADSFDRKKVFWIGIAVFLIGSIAGIFSWNLGSLLVFRALQGVGASMIFATNMAILVEAFDEKERGKVLGISTCATYIGLSSGPVLGGVLNQHFGWESILVVSSLIALIALYMALTKIPNGQKTSSFDSTFDIKGTLLYCIGIICSMYGISTIHKGLWAYFVTFGGVIFFVIFIKYELKLKDPIVKVELFKNKGFAFSNLAALMNYGATFAVTYLLSMYLQVAKGETSQSAGLVLITAPLVQAILSPLAGKLSDKYSPFKLSSIGMGICALALFIFVFIKIETSLWIIILGLVIIGIGFALFSSPNTNAVMGQVEKENYSIASSILATMRSIGNTISMAIVTLIIGLYMGTKSMRAVEGDVLMQTISTCFIVFCIVSIIGIFISLKRK